MTRWSGCFQGDVQFEATKTALTDLLPEFETGEVDDPAYYGVWMIHGDTERGRVEVTVDPRGTSADQLGFPGAAVSVLLYNRDTRLQTSETRAARRKHLREVGEDWSQTADDAAGGQPADQSGATDPGALDGADESIGGEEAEIAEKHEYATEDYDYAEGETPAEIAGKSADELRDLLRDVKSRIRKRDIDEPVGKWADGKRQILTDLESFVTAILKAKSEDEEDEDEEPDSEGDDTLSEIRRYFKNSKKAIK